MFCINDILIFNDLNLAENELNQHNKRMAKLLVFAANEALDDDKRDILFRKFIKNESAADIAKDKKISRGAVYRSLEASKQILKEKLKYAQAYRELMAYEELELDFSEDLTFGEQIKKARQKKLLTVSQLADILETEKQNIIDLENGKALQDINLIIETATFLRVPFWVEMLSGK